MLLLRLFPAEGGVSLDYILTLFVSVLASVVGYYICKWFDGRK